MLNDRFVVFCPSMQVGEHLSEKESQRRRFFE